MNRRGIPILKALGHIVAVVVLTLTTQVGGIAWILNFGTYRLLRSDRSRLVRFASFVFFYLVATFLVVPPIASSFGRVSLNFTKSGLVIPHNYITPLLNRHYVRPRLRDELLKIATAMKTTNEAFKLSYLDANFPFLDGFPLLPHLSHSDGRKIDLAFYYTKDEEKGNLKPSNLGYGKFVEPLPNEVNQTEICMKRGYWQYDYAKYLTLGSRNDLEFDLSSTRKLVREIVNRRSTDKLLIEPHLENRLGINSNKIRFQGCHAVRHDDHIHYQIRK